MEPPPGSCEMNGLDSELPLTAQTAKRPAFVPEFSEEGDCRMNVFWDPAELNIKGLNPLACGRPVVPPPDSSDSQSETSGAEEQIECQFSTQSHCAPPSSYAAEIEEDFLTPVKVDRDAAKIQSHQLLASLDELTNNSHRKVESSRPAVTQNTVQNCVDAEAPNTCAAPVDAGHLHAAEGVREIATSENYTPNSHDVIKTESPHSAEVQKTESRPTAVNSDTGEEELQAKIVVRKRQPEFGNASIEFTPIAPREDVVETGSLDEEPIIEFSVASPAHCAPVEFQEQPAPVEDVELSCVKVNREIKVAPDLLANLESTQRKEKPARQYSVLEELIIPVKIPKKTLDEKLVNNNLFTLVDKPAEQVPDGRDSDEGSTKAEEEIIFVQEATVECAPPTELRVEVQEDFIIPQKRVSNKCSAGFALEKLDQQNNAVHATDTSKGKATVSPGDKPPVNSSPVTKSPKNRSKRFFTFFKRTPKDKKQPEQYEKAKSLPKTMTVAETEQERTGGNKPPAAENKKSGFFTFGSRGRRKAEKTPPASGTPDSKPKSSSGSLTVLTDSRKVEATASATTTPKAATSPRKTNIRIFEIMAQKGGKKGEEEQRETSPPHDELIPIESVTAPELHASVGIGGLEMNAAKKSGPGNGPDSPNYMTGTLGQSNVRAPPINDETKQKYLMVVAIDFGTTFSGYAFSFVHDPDSIHMMAKWEGGDPGVINQKTPTILLLTPEGQFHSFGFTARNHYHDLSPDDAMKWLYFDKFKMSLYKNTECSRQTAIVAANGVKFSALEAVKMTLEFFKSHALTELSGQCGTEILNDDIRWIITVPAIWTAPAKQFMRVAAYEAGLASPNNPDQLIVALEPEAASVHIRRLRMNELVPDKPVKKPLSVKKPVEEPPSLETVSSQFKTVARYMVVDCGGGTVDITVHDINAVTGQLHEVYKSTGGAYGSCGIDADFETLLGAIFSKDFIDSFRRNRPSGWVGLMMAFESRKRAASPFKSSQPLNIALPFVFIDYYKKMKGSTVEQAIHDFGEVEIRWSSQGMLRLSPVAMNILFEATVDNIVETVADIFVKAKGIQNIFLVGGLSESPILQYAMRQRFGAQARVIVPQEASLAVLKGAVCFGLDTSVVAERRSKLTYGAAVLHRFLRGKHPESKLVRRDGGEWCKDVLDKFVVADQIVRRGETVMRCYTPATAAQAHISVSIYSTERSDAEYVTDPGVTKCAAITLDLTRSTSPTTPSSPAVAPPHRRKILTYMTFADTEIKVTAVDGATGEKVNADIDFLSI